MKLTKYDWTSIVIVVLLFAISFYLYPSLPDELPMHWNASGEVDGWSGPSSIFMFPVIIALVYALFLVLPKIAVFKKNVQGFKHFEGMKLMFTLFLSSFFAITLLAILGYTINVIQFMLPAIGLMFMYIGYIIPHIKRNYFIGIRTPWTLASDFVWKETHTFGGKLFMLVGVLFVFLIFVNPVYIIYLILIKVFGLVAILFVYSYLVWKRHRDKKTL